MGVARPIRLGPVESDGHAELSAAKSLKFCTRSFEMNSLEVQESAVLSIRRHLVLESLVLRCHSIEVSCHVYLEKILTY